MVEVKTENPEGRVLNDFRGHGRIKILEFPKGELFSPKFPEILRGNSNGTKIPHENIFLKFITKASEIILLLGKSCWKFKQAFFIK